MFDFILEVPLNHGVFHFVFGWNQDGCCLWLLVHCNIYEWVGLKCVVAELSRMLAQQSTMGKKMWLSMYPRNLGSEKIIKAYIHPFM